MDNSSFSTPVPPPLAPQTDSRKVMAIVALVLGILTLCAWILPICGAPLAIIGIILGVLGLQSSNRTLAIIGIVLSALGLIGSCINAALGIWMGTSAGQQWLYELFYQMGVPVP